MSFEKLNLKQFFPNDLINIKNKVLRTWNNIDKYKSDLDLKKIISNVVENISISYLDFSAIIYNIKKVEALLKNENISLDMFLSMIKVHKINNDIDIISLFEDIYEAFISYYKDIAVEKTLCKLIERHIDINKYKSTKFEIYKEYVMSKIDFFNFTFTNVKNAMLWDKWEEKLKYYSISEEREIFYDVGSKLLKKIVDYISIKNENVDSVLSNLLDKRSFQEKVNAFRLILNNYSNMVDVEQFSDFWMKKILKTLGHPDKSPINWIEIEEIEIETMKRWLVKNQLEEIFTIEVKDKRRLEFWKKYISYIRKVEFYKELNQAIIMETDNHTFIEFGENGNAFYIHQKNYIDIKYIDSYKNLKKTVLSKIRNREESTLYLSHSGSWERKFMYELQYLDYEIKGKNYGYNR